MRCLGNHIETRWRSHRVLRLQSPLEETLTGALRTSLEWYLDGVDDPGARWLALQQACQRLEHQLAAAPVPASDMGPSSNHAQITTALRRAAQEIQANLPDAGSMPASEVAIYRLN